MANTPGMSTLAQTNARCGANVELCFEPNRRGARKSLAALQGGPMVKRIAPSRIIWFCLLAACGALCQSESLSADFVYGDGSNPPELQLPVSRTWESLPDTPSETQAKEFRRFFGEAHSPLTLVAVGADARAIRKTKLDHVKAAPQPSFAAHYKAMSIEKGFSGFLGRNLYPSLLKRNPGYHPSTSGSLMGRATYAASRILITRDDYGKNRLNTSYFLGVLTSVAMHTANRPYWARSGSTTFNNFGSTIGGDTGINLFHEFRPGLLQMMKVHTPTFVSKIEARITHVQTRRDGVSLPAR
jgi:hypothetical protein